MQKPSIPKGTRDFGPDLMAKRNYIFNIIKSTFEQFGFQPLETPAMEQLSVLTGKYGQEGDQLLFKVLNSGDFLNKTTPEDISKGHKHLTFKIAEKGLRYDLTVPFARYVVMNQGTLNFPFKRYQIQPVWRADRPQKGRYREFYQCDADVVGTDSLLCEAEFIMMINDVFSKLGLKDYKIKLNNRKILSGIAEAIGAPDKMNELCVALDKLDKIGKDKVEEELRQQDFDEQAIAMLQPVFKAEETSNIVPEQLKALLQNSEVGAEGINEIEEILDYLSEVKGASQFVKTDITLARGLTYYTGAIFEVTASGTSISSSIGGGGRYDNLTGVFGLEGVSGVGFSFGIERIFDVMEELSLFPEEKLAGSKLLITYFDKPSAKYALNMLKILRSNDVACEIYPSSAKLKKQMNYANKKQIPYVLMVGSREIEEGKFGLKNMLSGEQKDLNIDEILDELT